MPAWKCPADRVQRAYDAFDVPIVLYIIII